MTALCLRLAAHYTSIGDYQSAIAELYKAMSYNQSRHGGEHSAHIRSFCFRYINRIRKLQRAA